MFFFSFVIKNRFCKQKSTKNASQKCAIKRKYHSMSCDCSNIFQLEIVCVFVFVSGATFILLSDFIRRLKIRLS